MYIGRGTPIVYGVAGIILVIAVGFMICSAGLSDTEIGFCLSLSDLLKPLLPVTGFVGRFCGVPLWIVASVVLIIVPRTRFVGLTLLAAVAATVFCGDVVVKYLVERPRPFAFAGTEPLVAVSTLFSYPSVHTALAFAACPVLRAADDRTTVPVLVFGVLVGISRIAVLAHFPTDVLMGAVLGLVVGTVAVSVISSVPKTLPLFGRSCSHRFKRSRDSASMVSIDETTRQLFADHKNGLKYFSLATSSKAGVPNVVPIGFLWIEGDEIRVVDNYLNKTLENILENPVVAVYAIGGDDGHKCVQVKGKAVYQTSGPEYEAAVAMAHAKNKDFPAKGLVRITVCREYDTAPGLHAGELIKQ